MLLGNSYFLVSLCVGRCIISGGTRYYSRQVRKANCTTFFTSPERSRECPQKWKIPKQPCAPLPPPDTAPPIQAPHVSARCREIPPTWKTKAPEPKTTGGDCQRHTQKKKMPFKGRGLLRTKNKKMALPLKGSDLINSATCERLNTQCNP